MESSESSMRTMLGQHGGKGASLISRRVPWSVSAFPLLGSGSKLHLMNWLVVSGLFHAACRRLDPGQDLTSAPRWVEKKIGVTSRESRIVWLVLFGNLIHTRCRVRAKTGSALKAGQQKTWFWTEKTNGKLPVMPQLIVVASFSSFCSRLLHPDLADVPPHSDCLLHIKNKCVGCTTTVLCNST